MALKAQIEISTVVPGYCKAVINNPPTNMFTPVMLAELNTLVERMYNDKDLKIVVFESADNDFFMNHHDVPHRLEVPDMPNAAPFFYFWPFMVQKIINSPVLTIAKVRGRARAQGFEFALACDMRFASIEKALFSLVEIAGDSIPGGGGIEWLVRMCGRSRAMEIVCSGLDYDAKTGEIYGFINRALPDNKLDKFVDDYSKRIASFDKNILVACKKTINERSNLPPLGDLLISNHQLYDVDYLWPHPQGMLDEFIKAGFGQKNSFELDLPNNIGTLKKK